MQLNAQEQSKAISKPEDLIIRRWIYRTYGIKLPQWALWKMTPAEAVDFLKENNRAFSKVTEDNIIEAARREE